MSVDKPTALAYWDEGGGVLCVAAYALACSMLRGIDAPPPPRANELHAAAEAIRNALDLDAPVPIMRDLAADAIAAGLSVFE